MNSDDLFWSRIFTLIAIVFCVFILSVASCDINKNINLKEMVLHGENPIRAACTYGINREACLAMSGK